jgi:hypothetical protein
MKNTKGFLFAAALSVLAMCGYASASTILATDSGWIENDGSANAPGFDGGINNTIAGILFTFVYNNWFQFSLPDSPITSATLEIWNDSQNSTTDAAAAYNSYAASSFTYSGLASGPSLGSITLGAADTGVSGYVSIPLNSAALSFLNANLGGVVDFGGSVTPSVSIDPTTCCVAVFGFTGGSPVAELVLNASTVPEPSTWAMVLLGFAGLGYAGYRRQKVAGAANV